MRSVLGALVALSVVAGAPAAFAQTAAGDAGNEADSLQIELDRDWADLQNADCATACRALDSMRRAADRLCTLDSGDRCTRAQQRVKDAADRVRSTCPACATSAGKGEEANAPPPPPPGQPTAEYEAAPQGKRGGCASCASVEARDAGGALITTGLAAVGLALLRRRRQRKR